MNVFAVTVEMNGRFSTMYVRCNDEADAAEQAQAEMYYGGRVISVRFHHRETL